MNRKRTVFFICFLVMIFCCSASIHAAEKPKLKKKKITIEVGDAYYIKVIGNSQNKKVKWKTSSKKKGSLLQPTNKGVWVVGKKKGTVTITAKIGKKKLKCKVKIKKASKNKGGGIHYLNWEDAGGTGPSPVVNPTEPLTITATLSTITTGDTFSFSFRWGGKENLLESKTWSSSNTSVISVNSANGLAKAEKSGTSTITLTGTYNGQVYTASQVFTVNASAQETQENTTRSELAAAKAKGPAAFIDYCETHRTTVNIGDYCARYGGFTGVNTGGINVESDYKWAVDSLYNPWMGRFAKAARCDKTSNMVTKLSLFTAYLAGLYDMKTIGYGSHNAGWTLCPAIAKVLHDGTYDGKVVFGDCYALTYLIVDYAHSLGLKANLYGNMPSNPYHGAALVQVGSKYYVCDADMGYIAELANGKETMVNSQEAINILNTYGYFDVNKMPE